MEKKYADEYNKLQEINNKEMEELESEMNNNRCKNWKSMRTQRDCIICKSIKIIQKNKIFCSIKRRKVNNKKWIFKENQKNSKIKEKKLRMTSKRKKPNKKNLQLK